MVPINMPQVGQDIPTARIIEWRKKENDPVAKGEVIATVESDKATFEVQSEHAGILLRRLFQEGDEAEVFKPIAFVGEAGESIVDDTANTSGPSRSSAQAPARKTNNPSAAAVQTTDRLAASPSARRLAREHGIELADLRGSGPGERIINRDVLRAASHAGAENRTTPSFPTLAIPSVQEGDRVVVFSRMRQRIADRLALSQQTIPHFYLFVDVNMSMTMAWRTQANRNARQHITVTDLILKACAEALKAFDRMNAHVAPDRIVLKRSVNIGVATVIEEGLLVPVIPGADSMTLAQICAASKSNAEAARRGSINPNHVGTFTVTTLGAYGISRFLPVINPPECAILGVGAVEPRAVPFSDGVGVAQMMTLGLACDHRAVDGVYAARFLAKLKENLERAPERFTA